jgi:hypothetical protein
MKLLGLDFMFFGLGVALDKWFRSAVWKPQRIWGDGCGGLAQPRVSLFGSLRWKVLTPDAQINISKRMVEATPAFQNISNQKLRYSKLRWLRQLRHFKA